MYLLIVNGTTLDTALSEPATYRFSVSTVLVKYQRARHGSPEIREQILLMPEPATHGFSVRFNTP